MSHNTGNHPTSYEEIVRRTVVDPDSSVRPSGAQVQAAREGFRALDPDEQALHDRVASAVAALGAGGVTIEISRELVTLRGRVADIVALRAVEDAVARVPGVDTIHNQIVVGSP
jgi:BON domain-containing protein